MDNTTFFKVNDKGKLELDLTNEYIKQLIEENGKIDIMKFVNDKREKKVYTKGLTEEEKKERQKQHMKNWYNKNKERQMEYQRNYNRNKYNNDPVFKKSRMERSLNYYHKYQEEINEKKRDKRRQDKAKKLLINLILYFLINKFLFKQKYYLYIYKDRDRLNFY